MLFDRSNQLLKGYRDVKENVDFGRIVKKI